MLQGLYIPTIVWEKSTDSSRVDVSHLPGSTLKSVDLS